MKKRTVIAAAAVSAIAASLSACGVYGPDPAPSMKSTVAETTTAAAESEEELVIETKLPPSQTGAVEEAAPDDNDDGDSEAVVGDGGIEEIE